MLGDPCGLLGAPWGVLVVSFGGHLGCPRHRKWVWNCNRKEANPFFCRFGWFLPKMSPPGVPREVPRGVPRGYPGGHPRGILGGTLGGIPGDTLGGPPV